MANSNMQMTLKGDKELERLFDELPRRIIKKGLRKAMTAASTPILKAARAGAKEHVESGLLAKAMARKLKTYSNGAVVAVIGASRAVTGEYRGKKRVPANYLHLVEKGHGGPMPAPAYPFLEKAYNDNRSNALGIASAKLKESVEEEAEKLRNG